MNSQFTDSTGEGMAGAEDVSLAEQNSLKNTYYNGSKPCVECGVMLNPIQTLNGDTCSGCSRRKQAKLMKGKMA